MTSPIVETARLVDAIVELRGYTCICKCGKCRKARNIEALHCDVCFGSNALNRRDEPMSAAFNIGDQLARHDGSEWDKAIREYQLQIKQLKDGHHA